MSVIESTVRHQIETILGQLQEIESDLDWTRDRMREHQSIIDFHAANPDRNGADIYGRPQLRNSQKALEDFTAAYVRDVTRQEYLTKFLDMLRYEYQIAA